jgi:CDP-glucose 4,6-dehydratase
MLERHYQGRRALVTGHTGFKGSWLSEWLLLLGAEVHGYSLTPPTQPSLFDQLALAGRMKHQVGDIRDGAALRRVIAEVRPDYIFHLAAQPLVRLSYEKPLETYEVNVMGTANLLDALRTADWPCAVVVVTSDKCYENREWVYGYRESDPLGGHDPYSSSKAMAELVTAAYRNSFFKNHSVKIASARAGNVIGGGDWAADRIVPDCIRALQQRQAIPVRNKVATRPWQHVLEPLGGYLRLASMLMPATSGNSPAAAFDSAFNFGPALSSNRSVQDLVVALLEFWPGEWRDCSDPNAVHEATQLYLSSDKAFHRLGWKSVWDFRRTVKETVKWYQQVASGGAANATAGKIQELVRSQIREYVADGTEAGLAWLK